MVKRLYHYDQNRVDIFQIDNKDALKEKLAKGVYRYIVEKSPMGTERYFIRMNDFVLPPRLYGELEAHGKHIISSFLRRQKSLGVLLYGTGGAGKSLLAKYISREMMEKEDIPTIVIQSEGISELEYLISNISQPVVIILDEFEKMFEKPEDQNYLLTLLDGMYRGNFLFILTANEVKRVNPHFLNRPSRIRYALAYNGIDEDTVEEVLNDILVDKSKADDIKLIIQTSGIASIDVLKEFIDEVNQNPEEKVETLAKMFNISHTTARLDEVEFIPSNDLVEFIRELFNGVCERLTGALGLEFRSSVSFIRKRLYRNGACSISDISFTDCIKFDKPTPLGDGLTYMVFDSKIDIKESTVYISIPWYLTTASFYRASNGQFFFKQDLSKMVNALQDTLFEVYRDQRVLDTAYRQKKKEEGFDRESHSHGRKPTIIGEEIIGTIEEYINELMPTLDSKTVTFSLAVKYQYNSGNRNSGSPELTSLSPY